MEKTKRNPALIIIGVIMIISGVITFIVSAVQLIMCKEEKLTGQRDLCRIIRQEQMQQIPYHATYLWHLQC